MRLLRFHVLFLLERNFCGWLRVVSRNRGKDDRD
jgi:hypothetical protein